MANCAEVVTIEVETRKNVRGLRIAQLSDLHAAAWLDDDYLGNIAKQVLELKPHLVVWTGDFYLHSTRQLQRCMSFFRELHKAIPSFGILGNHDFDIDSHKCTEILEASGMTVLRNRFVDHPIDGFSMRLMGLDDYHVTKSRFDPQAFLTDPEVFKLLLVHQPAFVRLLPSNSVDLMLAGHLHGGQLHFPLIGAPYVPPPGGRTFIEAPHSEINGNLYHVNRGLGYSLLPIRIGAPPEITEILLK
jgi:predicted MPP superfamily phosphohydrolase